MASLYDTVRLPWCRDARQALVVGGGRPVCWPSLDPILHKAKSGILAWKLLLFSCSEITSLSFSEAGNMYFVAFGCMEFGVQPVSQEDFLF